MGMTNDGLSYWRAETEGRVLLETTIGDLLDKHADEIPEQEAVVYSCYPEFGGALDIRWSYAEFRERVNTVARGLIGLGLQKGEHIAVWAGNLPEWVLLEFAAAKAGLVLVTVNPVYRQNELEYVLKQGDVAALFFMARVRDHDCLATIRSMVEPEAKNGEVSSERLPALRYVNLIGAPPPGFPKGAMLSHRSVINDTTIAMHRLGNEAGPGDHYCLPLPFFHIAGAGIVVAIIANKMTLHPLLAFDPLKTLQIIKQENCALLFAVPTMLIAMLQHPEFETYRPTTLRAVTSGGAPVPVAVMEQVRERMGTDVAIVFGQTESTGGITLTLPDDSFELKSSTVGIPYPHVDVKIINPATGKVLPLGEPGELCCRGFLVMTGYYHMPEKTAEAIDSDGWLHTGDLATMNERGYINIVGRLKEMVIRGGENIFPREIEELLIRYPKVADAQVLGVPDAFFGEELLAVVLSKEGEQLTEEELREYCKGQISHQKIPRYFQFVTAFPMTASGKVQKFVLRENAIKALGLEEAASTKTA